ncbi:MAG: hypothetical protein ABIK99_02535 [candidate division WOR-3 bacterium]
MPSLWERVKSWLEDTTEQALKEAEDLTKKGRLKMQILSLNRSIKEQFSELGGLVYQLIDAPEDIRENAKVKEIVSKIKDLEKELKEKEKEYQNMKAKR